MHLLSKLIIRNFKGYRNTTEFPLADSNYLIGSNNAGKSAVLLAMLCFFKEDRYRDSYANKTEIKSKKEGSGRSDISLEFNIASVRFEKTRQRLQKKFPSGLIIRKSFSANDRDGSVVVKIFVNEKEVVADRIDKDVQKLLSGVNVSYIHPQEAEALLNEAQKKLRDRLLSNFGRHHAVSASLDELQESWAKLSKGANEYLSRALTDALIKIWPGCETRIELPKDIKDIITVSDISFQSSPFLPAVELKAQGNGAQSAILYQTHYILDSDMSLHKGVYQALWLIEEPECFLHADLLAKLGALLNGPDWLGSIQMIITTHSGSILSTAKDSADKITLYSMKDSSIKTGKKLSTYTDVEIEGIGKELGDPYFSILYKTISVVPSCILEDTRPETAAVLRDSGIPVSLQLNGITDVRKHVEVLKTAHYMLPQPLFFIVDHDDGYKQIRTLLEGCKQNTDRDTGTKHITVAQNLHVVILPEGRAFEDLFDEYDAHLVECANKLFGERYERAASKVSIPAELSRAHAAIRNKKNANGIDGAKGIIRSEQDVKDQFWVKVKDNNYKINGLYIAYLKRIIGI